jgi:uncharacterized protein with PIN domain
MGNEKRDSGFVIDSMLGKLAKWLRILGFDAHYQSRYEYKEMEALVVGAHRRLVSRREEVLERFPDSLIVHSDDVGGQLLELSAAIDILGNRPKWFGRCIICNVALEKASYGVAEDTVPEYVMNIHADEIRVCPLCKRFFWPGTHRVKMLRALAQWHVTEAVSMGR